MIVRSKAGGWIGWSRIDVVYVNADCQLGEVVLEAFGNLTVCTRDQFNNRGYELPGGGIFK